MSTRNIHVNTASYTLLVAGKKKNTGEEWDVLEFSSLTELKKYRKSHPEKMAFSYSYALSQGVDKQFRHINIAEADHFKQFHICYVFAGKGILTDRKFLKLSCLIHMMVHPVIR